MCSFKDFYFRVLAVVFMELGKQKKRQRFGEDVVKVVLVAEI